MLSQRALNLLDQLFNEQSNMQLPAGVAAEIVEIRQFIKANAQKEPDNLVKFPTSPRRGRPPQQPPSQES